MQRATPLFFASELSYEPLGEKKTKNPNPVLTCICNSKLNCSFKKYCISIAELGGGTSSLSNKSCFPPLHLYCYSCRDRLGISFLRKETHLLLPLSLKEGNWPNSKISFRILSRTLVYTGRNYCLSKRISVKNNPDLIWQGNYFSGLITLATDLNR